MSDEKKPSMLDLIGPGSRVEGGFIPPPPEKVDHPNHYGGKTNLYEAIKVIRAWGLGFSLGNAVKYIARAGRKPGESRLDDLKKARWYLDEEIAFEESKTQGLDPIKM